MSRWIAPKYLATKWVYTAWFGGGVPPPPPPGWVGGPGWLGPRWVSPDWLTQANNTPTSYFGLDGLSVTITESKTLLVKVQTSDVLSVNLGESFNLLYTRHLTAQDMLGVAVSESRALRSSLSRVDTLSVTIGDIGTVGGDLIVKTASDTLGVEINEAATDQIVIESGDALNATIAETSVRAIRIQRADALNISMGESRTIVSSGVSLKTATDSLNLTFAESRQRLIFETKFSSDILGIALNDVSLIGPGAITTYLQGADSLNVGISEAHQQVLAVDTETVTAADTLNVAIQDASQRIDYVFVLSGDTLAIAAVESSNVSKASVDPTWEDMDRPWGGATLRDLKLVPIFAKDFDFFQFDAGNDFHGKPINVVLERLGLTVYGRDRMGNWKEDPDLIKLVTGVWPIFRGQTGTVIKIYIGAQDDPEDPVEWEGPFEFTLGSDKFVDPIVSGRYISIRFESSGQPPWQLLSYDMEIKPVGRGI